MTDNTSLIGGNENNKLDYNLVKMPTLGTESDDDLGS